jgi:hypothetical protein
MANEFKHKDPGSELTQAEFIASDGTGHIFDSQATGDILYASSTTALTRLGVATNGNVLELSSGVPAWTASPTIGSTSWANANHAHAATNSGGTVSANDVSGTTLKSSVVTSSLESVGTLTALTVDDVAVNGKVITMTGSSGDTAVFTVGTNGTLSLVTVDTAGAAANIEITADGTIDINSAGVLTLDSGAAINIEPVAGSAILLDGTISIDAGVVTGVDTIAASGVITAGGFTIGSAAILEAELEILDGASVTTAELNIIDGNTSATGTTIADADRVVLNDNGTMVQVAVTDLKTYIGAGPTEAAQADMEDAGGTNANRYVSPEVTHFHPGVAKVWAKWEQTGGHTMSLSYNMTSVTDGSAAGDTDHVFATDFSGTNWIFVGTAGNGEMPTVKSGTEAAGTLTTITRTNSSASAVDSDNNFMAMYGDQ